MPKVGSSTTPTRIEKPASRTEAARVSRPAPKPPVAWRPIATENHGGKRTNQRADKTSADCSSTKRRSIDVDGESRCGLKYIALPARSKTTFTHDGSSNCGRFRIGVANVLITAVGFSSNRRMARSIDAPANLRLIALHIDDDVDIAHSPGNLGPTRSVPLGALGSVISTCPPKDRTSSKISA